MILRLRIVGVAGQLGLKLFFSGLQVPPSQRQDAQAKMRRRDSWIELQRPPELLCRLVHMVLAGVGITPEDVPLRGIGLDAQEFFKYALRFGVLVGAGERSPEREQQLG